ncbi:hypothetical protein K458DRAFT_410081 [Lentithecium fluviatile CBS 122367]|uniref:C3H1-type domain-containing protein n=1 Tax=Lentithecium fluviatile CBS 122367 TaxID=1168545 RepID=A0A6G1IFR6_9PLEO|nr:hypothetical protein K458DRAFT_410081 [Lentithecium fluviatile CBS 122367]
MHVEVLPLVMKAERDIREIAQGDKPANFPPAEITGVVTLEEAAGQYDTNIPVILRSDNISPRDRHLFPHDGAVKFASPNHLTVPPPALPCSHPPIEPTLPPCPFGNDCGDLECISFSHPREIVQQQADRAALAARTLPKRKIKKVDKTCRNALSCTGWENCRFLHQGDEDYEQALVNQAARQFGGQQGRQNGSQPQQRQQQGTKQQQEWGQNGSQQQLQQQQQGTNRSNNSGQQQKNGEQSRPRQLCRHRANFNKTDCPFPHRSPAADDSVEVNIKQSCRFGAGKVKVESEEDTMGGRGGREEQQQRGGVNAGHRRGGGNVGYGQSPGGGNTNGNGKHNSHHRTVGASYGVGGNKPHTSHHIGQDANGGGQGHGGHPHVGNNGARGQRGNPQGGRGGLHSGGQQRDDSGRGEHNEHGQQNENGRGGCGQRGQWRGEDRGRGRRDHARGKGGGRGRGH